MAYSYNEVKLDKGMYHEAGSSFTAVLERLDPSENYRGTPLEKLDAYQRQLKRFDIKVSGAGSDVVEKFYRTSDSAVLFPEYIARTVRAGMEELDILPNITASVTKFDGLAYRSIYSVPLTSAKTLLPVNEGGDIPTTEVKVRSNLINLKKRGRMLVASYEAIRFQKLDLFSVMLRQIGNQVIRMHLDDAIDTIISGDGNNNAADDLHTATALKITYGDLINFWNEFDPYNMNTMLVSPDIMAALLHFPEFQNPLTGLNFQGTGALTTPLGAKLIKTPAVPNGMIIGLDKGYALEMISASDVSVEYDRLIDKQLERAAITSISGFAKLYTDASKTLSIYAS